MGRPKSRKSKTNAGNAQSVPKVDKLDIDQFGVYMDWLLYHIVPMDTACPTLTQLFTMVEYLGSMYPNVFDLSSVIIIRLCRYLLAAKVCTDGNLVDMTAIAPSGNVTSGWDDFRVWWDYSQPPIENLTNMRFPGGTTA